MVSVLYLFIVSIKYVFPPHFFLIISCRAISNSNFETTTKKRLFILLISNKQGNTHTHIYTYTHIFFSLIYLFIFFLSRSHPKLVYFILNFIDMEMGMLCWLYIDGLAKNEKLLWQRRTFRMNAICVLLMILLVKRVVCLIFPPHFKFSANETFLLSRMLSKPTTTIQTNPTKHVVANEINLNLRQNNYSLMC